MKYRAWILGLFELTRPRLLVTSLELFPPELLASSSDKDSRLSVLCPLIIRILGVFSSWKLFNLGWTLLFGEVTNFPPAIWHHVVKNTHEMITCVEKWYGCEKDLVTQKHYKIKFWCRSERKHENKH